MICLIPKSEGREDLSLWMPEEMLQHCRTLRSKAADISLDAVIARSSSDVLVRRKSDSILKRAKKLVDECQKMEKAAATIDKKQGPVKVNGWTLFPAPSGLSYQGSAIAGYALSE